MGNIRILPDSLANQIAAGEVVERPASVVKELVENAIDAGAHTIRVSLLAGGRTRVEVEDDGQGMDGDDALMALERHATSKLASAEELAGVATLGFRGEALPSIASVSRLTLETADSDGSGTAVAVEFGTVVSVRPHARPRGTRVVVEDLFARLPARRKFLRAEATELRHALTMVTGLAFARPTVAFRLEHNRKPLLDLPPARDLAGRLADLLGGRRARDATSLSHRHGELAIHGFLLPADGAPELVVAVNRRPVRDRLLTMTLNRALRGPSGRAEASAFVAIELPPGAVDVNVHPAKTEVRFANPGDVIAALGAAIAGARPGLHGPVPVRRVVSVPPSSAETAALPWGGRAGARWPAAPVPPPRVAEPTSHLPPAATPPDATARTYLGQYRSTYLLVEDAEGLLLVDQHAAHERVLFEKLLGSPAQAPAQRLLLPELLELSPAKAALAGELADDLRRLGLDLEVVSGNAVRVQAVPAALPGAPAARLVGELLDDVAHGSLPGATVRERLAASLACRAAIKKHRPMADSEARALLHSLAECAEANRCPHGRPIVIRLAHEEIERRIGRR